MDPRRLANGGRVPEGACPLACRLSLFSVPKKERGAFFVVFGPLKIHTGAFVPRWRSVCFGAACFPVAPSTKPPVPAKRTRRDGAEARVWIRSLALGRVSDLPSAPPSAVHEPERDRSCSLRPNQGSTSHLTPPTLLLRFLPSVCALPMRTATPPSSVSRMQSPLRAFRGSNSDPA